MKIAIIGSRGITIDNIDFFVKDFVKDGDEIVSGGAFGVDLCAREYAKSRNLKITEFLPDYKLYGKAAPIVRNRQIVDYADKIIVIWDGRSRGSLFPMRYARKTGKSCTVITL